MRFSVWTGHTEDPQTLNKYTYVRNDPEVLTDPSGLDFYLTCQKDSATCQGGRVGTTDKKGNFTATIISNDKNGQLVDQQGNVYTAKITGQGVSFNGAGSKEYVQGVFLNGTKATTIQGSADLAGFTFNFTSSNLSAHVTARGTFRFNGTPQQAEKALENAGYRNSWKDFANAFHYGMVDYRSPGEDKTGVGSGHFAVADVDFEPVPTESGLTRVPRDTVPTTGDVHFGETNPYTGGLVRHTKEVIRSIIP